jgi:hypothetical protein
MGVGWMWFANCASAVGANAPYSHDPLRAHHMLRLDAFYSVVFISCKFQRGFTLKR